MTELNIPFSLKNNLHRKYNTKSDPYLKYELKVITMCQCVSIIANIPFRMLIVGEVLQVWRQRVCGNSIHLTQFSYEPIIALKSKVYINKHTHTHSYTHTHGGVCVCVYTQREKIFNTH